MGYVRQGGFTHEVYIIFTFEIQSTSVNLAEIEAICAYYSSL